LKTTTETNKNMTSFYSRVAESQVHDVNKIYTNGQIEWVRVYFKIALTTHTIYYNIPIHWTITRFLKKIHMWIMTDFEHLNEEHATFVIETGQHLGEEAPCLQPDDNTTFKERFILTGKWPSFYVDVTAEGQSGLIVNY
jgi:hypothetical protein